MKFFIDTANIAQIKEAKDLGILDGVTTNPSLMAKEGIKGEDKIYEHYVKICELVKNDVSAEVISTDYKGIIAEGKKLAALSPAAIVVKVPMIKEGVKAIKYLSDQGIKTNCTLVFSAGQAILAAKAGATYVSPFIGRVDDTNWDGLQLISQMVQIYSVHQYQTEVLAASIRSSLHIVKCAEMGANVANSRSTGMLFWVCWKHPLTDSGLEKFFKVIIKRVKHKKAICSHRTFLNP